MSTIHLLTARDDDDGCVPVCASYRLENLQEYKNRLDRAVISLMVREQNKNEFLRNIQDCNPASNGCTEFDGNFDKACEEWFDLLKKETNIFEALNPLTDEQKLVPNFNTWSANEFFISEITLLEDE